ncbi:MAG TPA: 2-amino-4-hydroxy-6-hydroxymethyldihydropteridine diphosphokinase [Ignavibacteria bacterium]|nr:2-amino-4-hydroxy-6-hydroxymethyldihydropteridine diphosphokinase [Ignavibacteria bacterium]
MTDNIVYIGIGTNKGEKLENINAAISLIVRIPSTGLLSQSSIYETKPYGYLEQGNFLNLAIKIKTGLAIKSLLKELQSIEQKLGRIKTIKWGPRIIDLDILFYNDEIISEEEIKIPHPGIAERDFVLVPLKEIEPDFIHPALNEKIADICNAVLQKQIICKIEYTNHNS